MVDDCYLVRFIMYGYPSLSIFAGTGALAIISFIKNRYYKYGIKAVLLVLLLLSNSIAFSNNRPILKFYDPTNYAISEEERYAPFNEIFSYINAHPPAKGDVILNFCGIGGGYYAAIYHIPNKTIGWLYDFWEKEWAPFNQQTPSSLYEYCKKNKVAYIIVPPTPIFCSQKVIAFPLATSIRQEILSYLQSNQDKRFPLVKVAEFAGNKLYLCKVKYYN